MIGVIVFSLLCHTSLTRGSNTQAEQLMWRLDALRLGATAARFRSWCC
jgi:hypothetical protein